MAKAGPILLISSDYPQFDPDQLQRYTDEGYRVHYIENADVKLFQQAADDIETSEPYGIIGKLDLQKHPREGRNGEKFPPAPPISNNI